eukprot:1132481-Rhodomonas_salina.4
MSSTSHRSIFTPESSTCRRIGILLLHRRTKCKTDGHARPQDGYGKEGREEGESGSCGVQGRCRGRAGLRDPGWRARPGAGGAFRV